MKNQYVIAIIYGFLTILIMTVTMSIIMTLVIKYTLLNESTFHYLTLVIGLLSYFIGGIVTGLKSKGNGWLIGLIVGTAFSVLAFLIQFTGYEQGFSAQQMLYHSTYILLAVIGSILGVNGSSKLAR